jgi:hypothetical protein
MCPEFEPQLRHGLISIRAFNLRMSLQGSGFLDFQHQIGAGSTRRLALFFTDAPAPSTELHHRILAMIFIDELDALLENGYALWSVQ